MLTQVLLVTLGFTVSAAPQWEVPLTVREHANLARRTAPVRGGVPFPRGQLTDGAQARLVDSAGGEVPCAVRPLARWYDGSVKWLAVDARVDLAAGGLAHVRISCGS